METSLAVEELNDTTVAEIVAEETSKELDDILDEVVNLAKVTVSEESMTSDLAAVREANEEYNEETVDVDSLELELEIELPGEGTEPQTGIESGAEKKESAADRLMGEEDEITGTLAKKTGIIHTGDPSPIISGNDSVGREPDAVLAGHAKTSDLSTSSGSENDSVDQLAALLSKKIEATIATHFEARLSTVVEHIVLNKINKILASIR